MELHQVVWKKARHVDKEVIRDLVERSPTFGLDLNWVDSAPLLPRALRTALEFGVTVYEALYVALADRLNAPLYTADRALSSAKIPNVSILPV